VRQAVDENGEVVAYNEFDPYGNPNPQSLTPDPYGFTGEWWESDVGLLHLRARWYLPYLNQFLSPDPIIPDYFNPQSLNQYTYAYNNPVNLTDPTGLTPNCESSKCKVELLSTKAGGVDYAGHFAVAHIDRTGQSGVIEAVPSGGVNWETRILEEGNFNDIGNPLYWNPIRHPYSTDAGQLIASIRFGATPQVVEDYKIRFEAYSTVVAEGEEVCDLWECLRSAMEQIERNEIGYTLLGPNSNSAAISVLRKCKLPWYKPGQALIRGTERHHPGWALYLLGGLANGRSARKSSHQDFMDMTNPMSEFGPTYFPFFQ
jgi:RHS repeat-associated protein